MMNFLSSEMYKGLSDLPIFILAMFFSIFLRKFEEKKVWSQMFMLLAEASFIGAAVHMLSLEGTYKKIAWAVLYVLLYEVIRNLSLALSGHVLKENVQYPKLMWWIQIVLFIASFVLLIKGSKYDIYVFVGFAVINIAWLLYLIFKEGRDRLSGKLILFFGMAVLAAAFQGLKEVIPYGVVWGHLAIIVAVCVLFSISLED
ncbi:MAG: hypothetical protein Q4E99_00640 [Bacillota bacterium]|nr:hypothetical protein [Bacillota bacterium]